MASKTQKKLSVVDDVVSLSEDEKVYKMLAGYIDDEGIKHETFTLRELNGKDEEAIYSSTHKQNGAKITSLILERCVTSIGNITRKEVGLEKWREIIHSLYVGDQDYMFIKLREMSIGEEFEVKHKCPACGTDLTTYISIEELEIEPFKGEYTHPFELPRGYKDRDGELHTKGTMRLATALDREILNPVAKKNIAKGTSMMLTRLCEFDSGITVTQDMMGSLTVRDRNYLQKIMNENMFGVNTETNIDCTECGESFKATLNPTNFI